MCDCGTTLMRCNSFMHSHVPAMKQEKPAPCFSAVRAPSTSAGAAIYAAFHYLESTRPTAWTPRKSPREQARKTAAQSRPAQRAKRPKCYRVYSNVSGIKAVMGACSCAIDGEADCSTLCPGGKCGTGNNCGETKTSLCVTGRTGDGRLPAPALQYGRFFCRAPSLSCMDVCVCVHVLPVISLTASLCMYACVHGKHA